MKLSLAALPQLRDQAHLQVPDESIFALPEKVLQFGTGVLLRGLCDQFIDQANKQGVFNGRIVVVKSTDRGDASAFGNQDNLYTVCVRGLDQDQPVEQNIINASVSRTLSAKSQWSEVLNCAHNPALQVVISNTTEVGIQYVEESIFQSPPASFPAKLLAFLYERFQHLPEVGLVIVPTELIVGNGTKLQEICLQLAAFNKLSEAFVTWLNSSNHFCNSLVDRIVPGKPDPETLDTLYQTLGYTDELLAVAEVYRLWAIEGGEAVRKVLSFAQTDASVIIEPDIEIYRELKLRLLNGTHSLTCGLAYLSGKNLVRENMNDPQLSAFVERLMLQELALGIPYPVAPEAAEAFGQSVLSRFRNPFLKHKLLDITLHYSSKMKARNVPLLLTYHSRTGQVPELFALGFAGYLLFMKAVQVENGQYFGLRNNESYLIQDDQAPYYHALWQHNPAQVVAQALRNEALWGADLTQVGGFEEKVLQLLNQLLKAGANETLANVLHNERVEL